jgi:hypothetical protein
MANRDRSSRCARVSLTVIDGGRRQREEELLKEFLHPGVGNLKRICRLAGRLKPRAKMDLVNCEGSRRD